jgi:hypothetical protein
MWRGLVSFPPIQQVLLVAIALTLTFGCSTAQRPPEAQGGQVAQAPLPWAEECNEECAEEGKCTLWRGECVATSATDCRASERCQRLGRCGADLLEGECVVDSVVDCRDSTECTEDGDCYYNRGRGKCDDGRKALSLAVGIAGSVHAGGGGAVLVVLLVNAVGGYSQPGSNHEPLLPDNAITPLLVLSSISLAAAPGLMITGFFPVMRPDAEESPALVVTPGGGALRFSF